eukprot:GEMP01057865.1.p1 GENE.GEMP01057865.1~~GEMP01057865.1.p1  ORF type:complete len:140 (+),score=33.04 GEMP01057865.1:471-890(+)
MDAQAFVRAVHTGPRLSITELSGKASRVSFEPVPGMLNRVLTHLKMVTKVHSTFWFSVDIAPHSRGERRKQSAEHIAVPDSTTESTESVEVQLGRCFDGAKWQFVKTAISGSRFEVSVVGKAKLLLPTEPSSIGSKDVL